jgi:hypothetical protein
VIDLTYHALPRIHILCCLKTLKSRMDRYADNKILLYVPIPVAWLKSRCVETAAEAMEDFIAQYPTLPAPFQW